ncbi:MAG: glycosyltransferase [Chitinophagales bacterium]|nr:glycosyltransferase [Chitinophagales bacterium]
MKHKCHYDFCLLIPCYNNISGLRQSLKSVHYTNGEYLIVIVDDGSAVPVEYTDLGEAGESSGVTVILKNDMNQGITFSLNKGLNWVFSNTDCSFIARLDCGDICSTDRFSRQVEFMKKHSSVGLLGCWVSFLDKAGSNGYKYKTPVNHKQLLRAMYFRNVFIHPGVMIRRKVLEDNNLFYPDNFPHAEDYAFFWSIIHVSQSYILNDYLVLCEINKNGISYKNRSLQLKSRYSVVRKFGKSGALKILSYFYIHILRFTPLAMVEYLKKSLGKN